jgi:2-dehydro-3-deoxygluconokinase
VITEAGNGREHRAGLLTFGETMGLVVADGVGTLEFVRNFSFGIGGAESNVAIGAARLGAPVTWIGRIGPDATGDLIRRRLQAEGVGTIAIRDPSFTGLMVRHARAGGVRHVDYHRAGSAGSHLTPDDIPNESICRAAIVHITGITPALSDSARTTVFHAVAVAKAAGVLVSVDINYRAKLWDGDTARPVLRRLVSQADIVFGGIGEAQVVLDTTIADAERLARELAALGPHDVVIKEGAQGSTAVIADVALAEPALPVAVVDPVGAGDAFVAGYLVERLADAEPRARLRTAIAMGAYAVTVPGDCESLPTRSELSALADDEEVIR